MEESHAMLISTQNSDSPGAVVLSVALIDPDNQHRREVAGALAGFPGYIGS